MSRQPGAIICFDGKLGYTSSGGVLEENLESAAKTGIAMRTKVYLFLLVSILIFFSFLTGCALYDPTAFLKVPGAKAVAVESSADQIILQWDPPATDVTRYFVVFRMHGEAGWVPLGDIPASPAPEFPVQYAVLGNGDFDFAIIAQNSAGEQSTLHISLDSTAQPSSGWFLRWRK
jgi:hypothetical protein